MLSFLKSLVLERAAEPKAFSLVPSLAGAKITRVSWDGRYSRTGRTFFVRKIDIDLRTGKYDHKLSCWSGAGVWFCDWYADSKYMGIIEIKDTEYPIRKALDLISFALTTEMEDNEVVVRRRIAVEPERIREFLPRYEV